MQGDGALRRSVGQLIRFGMVGGFVTALGVAAYYVAGDLVIGVAPLLANLLGYRGRGGVRLCPAQPAGASRAMAAATIRRSATGRFFIVSLVSLGLNSLFVWRADRAVSTGRPGGRSSRCCS